MALEMSPLVYWGNKQKEIRKDTAMSYWRRSEGVTLWGWCTWRDSPASITAWVPCCTYTCTVLEIVLKWLQFSSKCLRKISFGLHFLGLSKIPQPVYWSWERQHLTCKLNLVSLFDLVLVCWFVWLVDFFFLEMLTPCADILGTFHCSFTAWHKKLKEEHYLFQAASHCTCF